VESVAMASGVGHNPERWSPGVRQDFRDLRLVVTNLAVLDFGGPKQAMRIVSVHPGVTVEQVKEQTTFDLVVADHLKETRKPDDEQLRLIREVLDPHNLRASVFRGQ
jgi:glutaconate CoA-transferase subunit B